MRALTDRPSSLPFEPIFTMRHRFASSSLPASLLRAALLGGIVLLLAACGQKGPLYLPERDAAPAPTDGAPAQLE